MKLTLSGHDDRYAVEQLQLSLFPEQAGGEAVSALHRGQTWLTATTRITLDGKTVRAVSSVMAFGSAARHPGPAPGGRRPPWSSPPPSRRGR